MSLPGSHHTPESIAKMRQAHTGRKHTPETLKKMHLAHPGHKLTPENREKLRQYNIGHTVSPATREKIGRANTGRKFTPAAREKMSQAQAGRKHTAATREKMRLAHTGHKATPETLETLEKMRQVQLGKRHTPETLEKMRRIKQELCGGEKSHFWRGGVTVKNYRLRRTLEETFEHKHWHREVLLRDNFTCQGCTVRGGRLHVHHIKPFQKIIDEFHIETLEQARVCEPLWDISNGVTLCGPCHRRLHANRKEVANGRSHLPPPASSPES